MSNKILWYQGNWRSDLGLLYGILKRMLRIYLNSECYCRKPSQLAELMNYSFYKQLSFHMLLSSIQTFFVFNERFLVT